MPTNQCVPYTPAHTKKSSYTGPFEKTLTYDASPLAQPLLGAAGEVAFGVPVYSKAASLMAMVSHYAALAGPAGANTSSGVTSVQQLQFGPVADLRGSTPPNPLQVCVYVWRLPGSVEWHTCPELLAMTCVSWPTHTMSSNVLCGRVLLLFTV